MYTQEILRYSVERPTWSERDRFILSKGHAGPALYVVLAAMGFFRSIGGRTEVLRTMGKDGAVVGRHPDNIAIPGIDCTSGALGEGLGVAAGMALGLKRRGSKARVFVLLGDGESDLGPVWEAADFIVKQKLDNIIVTIDMNGLGYCNPVSNTATRAKWEGFGWNVCEAAGHNLDELAHAYKSMSFGNGRPNVLLARTEKGHGSATAGMLQSHSFTLPADALPLLTDIDLSSYRPHIAEDIEEQSTPVPTAPDFQLAAGAAATRDVGYALEHWVTKNPCIIPVCPDVEESTRMTDKMNFVHMGIKEVGSVSVAAGLASVGYIPVVSMFDDFLLGTLREVKNTVVIPKLPVILMTTHSGVGLGKDGATHHSMAAPAALRTFEEIIYFEPADLKEASSLMSYALLHPEGPYYIRLTRQPLENVCPFDDTNNLEWVTRGAYSITPGIVYDATIIATGTLVAVARAVAEKLNRKGIRLNVVNCFSPSLFGKLSPEVRRTMADPAKPIFTAIDAHPTVLSEFANTNGASYGITHTTPGGGDAPYFYKLNQLNASTMALNIENRCRAVQGRPCLTALDTVVRECTNILAYKAKSIVFIDGPTRAGTSTFARKLKQQFESQGIQVSGVLDSDYFLLPREARDVLKQVAYEAWLNNSNWFSWKKLAEVLSKYLHGEEAISLEHAYIHGQAEKQEMKPITTQPNARNILIVEGPFIINNAIRHFADYIVHLEASPAERWRRMMDSDNLLIRRRNPEEQAELNSIVYEPSRLLYESNVRGLFDIEIDNENPEAKKVLYITDSLESDTVCSSKQTPAIRQRAINKKTKKLLTVSS